eukprot:4053899-Prymnesium_polylepis.1
MCGNVLRPRPSWLSGALTCIGRPRTPVSIALARVSSVARAGVSGAGRRDVGLERSLLRLGCVSA